jgi:hypothetical protein
MHFTPFRKHSFSLRVLAGNRNVNLDYKKALQELYDHLIEKNRIDPDQIYFNAKDSCETVFFHLLPYAEEDYYVDQSDTRLYRHEFLDGSLFRTDEGFSIEEFLSPKNKKHEQILQEIFKLIATTLHTLYDGPISSIDENSDWAMEWAYNEQEELSPGEIQDYYELDKKYDNTPLDEAMNMDINYIEEARRIASQSVDRAFIHTWREDNPKWRKWLDQLEKTLSHDMTIMDITFSDYDDENYPPVTFEDMCRFSLSDEYVSLYDHWLNSHFQAYEQEGGILWASGLVTSEGTKLKKFQAFYNDLVKLIHMNRPWKN